MAHRWYNERAYQEYKQSLAATVVTCWRPGCTNRATSPDHDPPISSHTHTAVGVCCQLRPACMDHQRKQGAAIRNARSGSGYSWP